MLTVPVKSTHNWAVVLVLFTLCETLCVFTIGLVRALPCFVLFLCFLGADLHCHYENMPIQIH